HSPDALANPVPHAAVVAQRGRDVHGLGFPISPAPLFNGSLPRPTGAREYLALPAPASPAHDLQLSLPPDGQAAVAVAEEEAHLLLAAAVVDPALQPVPLHQLQRQLATSQGDAGTHGSQKQTFPRMSQMS